MEVLKVNIELVSGDAPSPISSDVDKKNIFIDRRKDSTQLLIILAGYKSFLYEDVFSRVKAFTPKELDICIISSGLFDEELERIARENNWSYLSTKENNVCLAQNAAITIYKKALIIYKMDEDIFVTENCFEKMLQTYLEVQEKGQYNVGFVAPLIPINGYGHVRILEIFGLDKFYEQKFERILYGAQGHRMIEKNPEVAKFMWSEGNIVPSIDKMNAALQIQKMKYRPCPVRFSIGFILFSKNLWQVMKGFHIPAEGNGVGVDEAQICSFCAAQSLAIIVSENVVVGHLSFGQQNAAMKEYYLTHRDKFHCPTI